MESQLRTIRSLKRAESLIDALLAPCIAAALADCSHDDIAPLSAPYSIAPNIVSECNPLVLIGSQAQRDAQWQALQDDTADKEYRRSKRSRKRHPCNEIPLDYRQDLLSWERIDFECAYPIRLAQANRRYIGNYVQWVNYCARNGLEASTDDIQPAHDTAQEMLADLWAQQWHSAIAGGNRHYKHSLRYPRQRIEPQEPIAIPEGLRNLLSPIESSVLARVAVGASEREIARETGVYRENIPTIMQSIGDKALQWACQFGDD